MSTKIEMQTLYLLLRLQIIHYQEEKCHFVMYGMLFWQQTWDWSISRNVEEGVDIFVTWICWHSASFAQCRSISYQIRHVPLLMTFGAAISRNVFEHLSHFHCKQSEDTSTPAVSIHSLLYWNSQITDNDTTYLLSNTNEYQSIH